MTVSGSKKISSRLCTSTDSALTLPVEFSAFLGNIPKRDSSFVGNEQEIQVGRMKFDINANGTVMCGSESSALMSSQTPKREFTCAASQSGLRSCARSPLARTTNSVP